MFCFDPGGLYPEPVYETPGKMELDLKVECDTNLDLDCFKESIYDNLDLDCFKESIYQNTTLLRK